MRDEEAQSLFLSAEKAGALAEWKSSEPNVASLHLPIDESGSFPQTLDRLIRDASAADPAVKAAARDVERMSSFVRGFTPGARRGLAVFSCAKYGIFEAFATPEPFAPSLRVSERPYLRPLNTLRGRYYRFISLQADERAARFTEIHLGEPSDLETMTGGFKGKGLAALADRALALYKARRADRLVLGAEPGLLAALEPLLDAELQGRLIHESMLGPDRPIAAVVERVRHNEMEALKLREEVLVARFWDELRAGGAVAGLDRVADALQQGCVSRVLVRDGWAKMGRCCASCGRLSVDHRSCPWCFRPTESVLDLVAELIDRAVAVGIEVVRIAHERRFDGIGRIGAVLSAPVASTQRHESPDKVALRARFALKDGRSSPLRPKLA